MLYVADILLIFKNTYRTSLRERRDTTKNKHSCNGDKQFHMQRLVAKSILEFRLTKIFYYINPTSVSKNPQFQPKKILHYYIKRSPAFFLNNFFSPKTICS